MIKKFIDKLLGKDPAGSGSKKLLLIGHMDTVYLKGMGEKQPFRIDGNRAYGLGISDDKAGVEYARGVHRFDFDGRYAYISPTMDGYLGNIVMILDLKDPAKPQEVGRWWMPGQHIAGGETPTWRGAAHKCHHPLRYGNRLYTSYWHGGFVILDIDDMSKPKFVSGLDWSPPFPWPTHTALRIPFKIKNRDFLVVSDEDVVRLPDCPDRKSVV